MTKIWFAYVFGALLFSSDITLAESRFLSLPFLDGTVKVQQGPLYTDEVRHFGGGFAIDYIRGTTDSSATWTTFDVVAAAGGVAIQSFEKGYGNFVLIKHDINDDQGRAFFTLYAHIADGTIRSTIPFRSRYDTDFGKWHRVETGELLGKAGATGLALCATSSCIHLHFEVFRGGYFQNPIDPYDISNQTEQHSRDFYPPFARFVSCGSHTLWVNCPPTVFNFPPPLIADGLKFDFVIGFLAVDGNIFGLGNPDGSFDFFDNFNDGSLTSFPTSFFFFPQQVAEEGGFLRFRSADGARTASRFGGTFLEDDAFLNIPLLNGAGNSEITASFRADTPVVGQFYGIGINNSGSILRESAVISVGRRSDGSTRVRVNDHTGTIIASDSVNLPSGGFILLRLFVNDATNQVIASYSVDNGATFKRADQFSFFAHHGTIFNVTSFAFVFAQGGVVSTNP